MGRSRSEVAAQLDQVQHRIDRWRSLRRKHSPMPEELWTAAASLARIYGVSMISRTLGLGYASLKDRAAGSKPTVERRDTGPVHFVELASGSLVSDSGPSVAELELSDADGAKLVVRLREAGDLNLIELAAAFWRRRS